MKIIKKCTAIFLYLLLMACFLRFDVIQLFDWKQICLVILGTVILCLPYISKEVRHLDKELIGQNALVGSMIACFVLVFVTLSRTVAEENIFSEIALSCRPLLYGFCIWVIFGGEFSGEQGKGEERGLTLEDCRSKLQEQGLTKREIEVSLLVLQGMTNGEIARELYISETTVKKHLSNIFAKLEIKNRESLREKIF